MTRLRSGKPDSVSVATRTSSHGQINNFRRREDGSLIVFGLFIFVIMLMIGGMAVDLMRYEAQRTRLQSTLDRAVLAAASLDQPLSPEAVVADYFDKAGLSAYLQDVYVEDYNTSRKVTASANMRVNSTFLNLLGITHLSAPAGGAAQESASQTEISLVVDVSGSMGRTSASGQSKIYELRRAATRFVNIMQCDPENPDATTGCKVQPGKVSISLVPYSEQVVAGNNLLSRFYVTNEQNDSTCVTFREDEFLTTAMIPDASGIPAWVVPHQRTGHFDPWSSSRRNVGSWTCRVDQSWREIQPLVGEAAVLRTRINNLGATGNTSIDVGMKWGAALLDPSIQPVISSLVHVNQIEPAFDGRPYAWDERGVNKVIVLMTDGVNTNQHYLYDGYREGPSEVWRYGSKFSVFNEDTGLYYWDFEKSWQRWQDHPYGDGKYWYCRRSNGTDCRWINEDGDSTNDGPGTASQLDFPDLWKRKPTAWYEQFNWLNNPGSSYGNSVKNARLDDICKAAKAQDITVFAVGFEVTSESGQIMSKCASYPSYYFNADGTNLSHAFAAIAREISKLRLVN